MATQSRFLFVLLIQAAVSIPIRHPSPSLFGAVRDRPQQSPMDLGDGPLERPFSWLSNGPSLRSIGHRASLRSIIANCVKLAYLRGGNGNLVRATMHLTADDPKGSYGGKEAQERRSGGGWPCRNRQNHPYRGPCACARCLEDDDGRRRQKGMEWKPPPSCITRKTSASRGARLCGSVCF